MKEALAALDDNLPNDPTERIRVLTCLQRILGAEVHRRTERRIHRRIEASKLPNYPTLEAFDFDFQTGVDRDLVLSLAALDWVERAEDLLLLGQSGVGKSHIAKSLALRACAENYRVRYATCADLLSDLVASLADNSLPQRLKVYTRPDLLVIDDLGYDPIEQERARQAQLLYKVLDARHGKVSTIVTSNLPVEEWPAYLGSSHLTVALLDRLLFRATSISIEGPSYRLAEHSKRQNARKATADREKTPQVERTKAPKGEGRKPAKANPTKASKAKPSKAKGTASPS